jgi:hypothetical protein
MVMKNKSFLCQSFAKIDSKSFTLDVRMKHPPGPPPPPPAETVEAVEVIAITVLEAAESVKES